MKIIVFLAVVLFTAYLKENSNNKQRDYDPVKISTVIEKISDHIYKMSISFKIDSPWHIYSQAQSEEFIGQPLRITIPKEKVTNSIYKNGEWWFERGTMKVSNFKDLGITQNYYEKTLTLDNMIYVEDTTVKVMEVWLTYQCCTDEKCLPLVMKSLSLKLHP